MQWLTSWIPKTGWMVVWSGTHLPSPTQTHTRMPWESTLERPLRLPPRSRVWRWIRLALLGCPSWGLRRSSSHHGCFLVLQWGTSPSPRRVPRRWAIGWSAQSVYTLEARAAEQWTFFDFSRGSVVDVPHQFGVAWDLAFQRHKILANGGATNPKGRGAILNLGASGLR